MTRAFYLLPLYKCPCKAQNDSLSYPSVAVLVTKPKSNRRSDSHLVAEEREEPEEIPLEGTTGEKNVTRDLKALDWRVIATCWQELVLQPLQPHLMAGGDVGEGDTRSRSTSRFWNSRQCFITRHGTRSGSRTHRDSGSTK